MNLAQINKKKIFLVLGFILLVFIFGYLIYYLFFKPATPPEVPPEEKEITQLPKGVEGRPSGIIEEEEAEPIAPEEEIEEEEVVTRIPTEEEEVERRIDTVAQGGVTRTSTLDYETTSSIVKSAENNDLFGYNPEKGEFYKVTPGGRKEVLSERIYKNVENITWSPDNNETILEFPDGTNVLYNFQNNKQITLPKEWTDFDFAPSGKQIAFKEMNDREDQRFISIANKDGSGQKYLENISYSENQFEVDWSPNKSVVAKFKEGATANTAELYFVGQHGENFKSIRVNGYGLQTQWTPKGDKLLYSAHNLNSDHKPLLHIVDASGNDIGKNHHSLKLNTWAEKCTIDNNNVAFCAVPKELPTGAGLAPEIADTVPDYIYKVDLNTGTKSFVAEPMYEYTIDQLTLSKDGKYLYFTDKAAKQVHSIQLK